MTHPPFTSREILHLWAATREYQYPIERRIVRAITDRATPHCNGLVGTVQVINAPNTAAMVNLWLPEPRGVLVVRLALDRLITAGVLTEQRIGNVLHLAITPSALPVDVRDSEPMRGFDELREAA